MPEDAAIVMQRFKVAGYVVRGQQGRTSPRLRSDGGDLECRPCGSDLEVCARSPETTTGTRCSARTPSRATWRARAPCARRWPMLACAPKPPRTPRWRTPICSTGTRTPLCVPHLLDTQMPANANPRPQYISIYVILVALMLVTLMLNKLHCCAGQPNIGSIA